MHTYEWRREREAAVHCIAKMAAVNNFRTLPSRTLAFVCEAVCWLSENRAAAVNRSARIRHQRITLVVDTG